MSTLFSGHYLRNRSTLDIGVLGYQRMSKVSSDHRNLARQGYEKVARAHSYLANIPEGFLILDFRHVLNVVNFL